MVTPLPKDKLRHITKSESLLSKSQFYLGNAKLDVIRNDLVKGARGNVFIKKKNNKTKHGNKVKKI